MAGRRRPLHSRIIWDEFAIRSRKALPASPDSWTDPGYPSFLDHDINPYLILTALLWIFRKDIALGSLSIPGWSSLFPAPELIHDSTVAMVMALILFLIPVDRKKGEFVLDWEWARRIPWGVLFLLGGGFALAEGFKTTGLAGLAGGFSYWAIFPRC